MRVQLTLEGGLYGRLELEPLDLDLSDPDLIEADESATIAGVLEPGFLENAVAHADEEARDNVPGHTDAETFLLSVTSNRAEDGDEATYRLNRAAIDSRPELKTLIDFLWRRTKPVTASEAS